MSSPPGSSLLAEDIDAFSIPCNLRGQKRGSGPSADQIGEVLPLCSIQAREIEDSRQDLESGDSLQDRETGDSPSA